MTAAPHVSMAAVELEAQNLSHRYGRRVGLRPVTFAAASPSVLAVAGPNGSGKSTLLRILAGLLRPSAGRTHFAVEGHEIAPAARRSVVGFASPDVAFYEEMTVHENLAFAAEARALTHPSRATAEALDRVELGDRAQDRVSELSSGMKQRLRLAFALLHQPRVLLLDEPGSHLDAGGRAMLEAVVKHAARDSLVVVASNDEKEWRLGDERIELGGGDLGRPA